MNPYERLLAQISEWDKTDGNIAKQRFGNAKGVSRWASVREAFRTLIEVDELLRSEEEDGEILIDALWEYFIQPSKAWTGSTSSGKISQSDLAHLRTQARFHEKTPLATRMLNESEVENLMETLGILREEIIDLGQGLGAAGARFLLLIDSCLTLLEQDDVDPAVVRAKAEQLVGAAVSIGPFIPEDRQRGFWETVRGTLFPWMGNASSGAAGDMLAEAFRNGQLPPVS